jgi:hypothetical protein
VVAVGPFTRAGRAPSSLSLASVAVWDSANANGGWNPLTSADNTLGPDAEGAANYPTALAITGSGTKVWFGGRAKQLTNGASLYTTINNIAAWTSAGGWVPVGTPPGESNGLDGTVTALAPHALGMLVGGEFYNNVTGADANPALLYYSYLGLLDNTGSGTMKQVPDNQGNTGVVFSVVAGGLNAGQSGSVYVSGVFERLGSDRYGTGDPSPARTAVVDAAGQLSSLYPGVTVAYQDQTFMSTAYGVVQWKGTEYVYGEGDDFAGIMYWTGSSWAGITHPGATAVGVTGVVYAATPYTAPGGTDMLAIAGKFSKPAGMANSLSSVALWSGNATGFLSLPNPTDGNEGIGVNGKVYTLAVLGGKLYLGGDFDYLNDGTAVYNLAVWNGTLLLPVPVQGGGTGFGQDGYILSSTVCGTKLIVGGSFVRVGGDPGFDASNLAALETTSGIWKRFGGKTATDSVYINGAVRAIATNDTQTCRHVWIGGGFTSVLGTPANKLAVLTMPSW